jgi:hypothetical protein
VAEDIVGELESKCAMRPVSRCVLSVFRPSPAARGVRPPFIDQGESESHARRAILAMRGSVMCYAVE